MADGEQIGLLKRSVDEWNDWRAANPGIRPDLSSAALADTNLGSANLFEAILEDADLSNADLRRANLRDAIAASVNLSGAQMYRANLNGAQLQNADLRGADLERVYLGSVDLSGADLRDADLRRAILVRTRLDGALLTGAKVHGISAWDLEGVPAAQTDLVITPKRDPAVVTVDSLDVAQFMYLLLTNEKIREVIDTVTSKVVLILGRFTEERKAVLDALREQLRMRNYSPIVFDFDIPRDRDITETVTLLARMARFVIADLTDPRSIPQEIQAIAPDVAVPIQPVVAATQEPWSMFSDLRRKYHWVLPPFEYEDQAHLLSVLSDVIEPAESKRSELSLS